MKQDDQRMSHHAHSRFFTLATAILAFSIFLTMIAQANGEASRSPNIGELQGVCRTGNGEACSELGVEYVRGKVVRKNLPLAVKCFERSCSAGHLDGCTQLAVHYESGEGVRQDLAKAIGLVNKACDGGAHSGCSFLAFLHRKGRGVPPSEEKALEFLGRACDNGNPFVCVDLGNRYKTGDGVQLDLEKSRGFFDKACNNGNHHHCSTDVLEKNCNLGKGDYCYEISNRHNKIDSPNYPRVIDAYERGCKSGHPQSCEELAFALYELDYGVEHDFTRAAKLYKKACDSGQNYSCLYLGRMYLKGHGVTRDEPQAAKMLQEVCDEEANGLYCSDVGRMYFEGRGVVQDDVKAARILQVSCDLEFPGLDCAYLGTLYVEGRGVKRDKNRGQKLINSACDRGVREACRLQPDPGVVSEVERTFSDVEQLLRGRVTASRCKGRDYREASGYLDDVEEVFGDHPGVARELRRPHQKLMEQMNAIRVKCFSLVVIPQRKGKCVQTVRQVFRELGNTNAKAATKGRHQEVLALGNVSCDDRAMRIHRENLEFVLKGCRFMRLECHGKTSNSHDFGWPSLDPEDFLRPAPY